MKIKVELELSPALWTTLKAAATGHRKHMESLAELYPSIFDERAALARKLETELTKGE